MITNEQISQFCRVQSLALKVTALLSVACSDRIPYQLRSLLVWDRQSFCWNGYSLEKLCASDPAISDSDSNSGQRKKSNLPKNNNFIEWKESYTWYSEWFMIANEQTSQFCRVQSLALKVTALLSVACSDRITIEFFALLRSSSILLFNSYL